MNDRSEKSSGFGIGELGHVPEITPSDLPEKIVKPQVRMVKCDCGHTVPHYLVMAASLGTACPDCFDEMSD